MTVATSQDRGVQSRKLPFICTCCLQALGEGHVGSPLPGFPDQLSLILKTRSILGGSPGTEVPGPAEESARPQHSTVSTRKHWKAQEPATAWPPTSFTSQVPEGRALGEWMLRGHATGCDTDFPFPRDPEA